MKHVVQLLSDVLCCGKFVAIAPHMSNSYFDILPMSILLVTSKLLNLEGFFINMLFIYFLMFCVMAKYSEL